MPAQNLHLRSNDISTYWTLTRVTATGSIAGAPDGTATASRVGDTAVNNSHFFYQTLDAAALPKLDGTVYCFSGFFKYENVGFVRIWGNGADGGSQAVFDIQNGLFSAYAGTDFVDAAIVSAGNGWYRVWLAYRSTASNIYSVVVNMQPTSGTSTYLGGSGTILAWGLQHEQSNSPGEFVATGAAVVNIGAPATKKRTPQNLLLQSQTFDNASWSKANGAAVVADAVVAPDGTTTADALTAGTSDTNTYISQTYTLPNTGYRMLAGVKYTLSVWMRADASCTCPIEVDDSSGSPSSRTTASLTTSWQRVQATVTSVSATTAIFAALGGGAAFPIARTVYLWGAQLIRGNAPGGYVATTTVPLEPGAPENRRLGQNLITASNTFTTGWTVATYPITVTAQAGGTAPDGVGTAQLLAASGGGSQFHLCYFQLTVAAVGGKLVTFSVYLKQNGARYVAIGTGTAVTIRAWFDLQLGTVTSQDALVLAATITAVGGGWYRCTNTHIAHATIAEDAMISPLQSAGAWAAYTPSGTPESVYAWGAQLEFANAAGDYTPTTTVTIP